MNPAPRQADAAVARVLDPAARLKLRGRQLLLALGLVAVLTVAVAVANVIRQRAAIELEAFTLLQLEARTLEGQVSPVADSTANALTAIAEWPSMQAEAIDTARLSAELQQQLPGLPFVRSLSLLGERGIVLSSSDARNVGLALPLARLEPGFAKATEARLGPHLPVRDLVDLADANAAAPTGLGGALPMLLRVERPGGAVWLVALISVDYIRNAHALMVAQRPTSASLLGLNGRLISHTGDVPAGRDLSTLPPFTKFLPDREYGIYDGPGATGGPALAAFRTAKRWPLVVLVERDEASVAAEQRNAIAAPIGAAAVILALLAGLGWTVHRSLGQEALALAEREALHAEVARTEERWARALNAAGQYVWELDLQGARFEVSASLNEFLGYGHEESTWGLEKWRAAIHPDDVAGALDGFARHERREVPYYQYEQRMRTAAGGWTWVVVRGTITRWDETDRRALAASGIVGDISVRKASEQALKTSEARQQAILESALDGIITMADDGQVIGFNPAAERIFGFAADEVIGRPMTDTIVPYQMRKGHDLGLARFRSTGEGPVLNRRIEIQGLRADGALIPIELAIVPVTTDSGQIFTATVRDISEQKRVQRELRANEERFRAVFEQAAVGIVQSDRFGAVQYANAAISKMLGCEPGKTGVNHLHDLLHMLDGNADPRNLFQMLLRGAESVSMECRFRHADGRWIWTRVSASLMRPGEAQQPVMLSIIEDISDRKRAEEQLLQARQRELDDGARIQRTLLSAQPDQRIPGLWIGAVSAASQVIDGDFVEVLPLGEGVVDIVVGDVMGKGVSAALFGAATKMAFSRSMATLLASSSAGGGLPAPATVVAAVHGLMTPSLQALESFVTISYLRVNTVERTISWVGCGSEEPLLVGHDGCVRTLANQHPPLGVLSELGYGNDVLPFLPGDVVFLASDGAADALLPDGSRLGRDRVNALIGGLLQGSQVPANVLHAFRKSIEELRAKVVDDLTLVLAVATTDLMSASRRELSRGVEDISHVRGLVGNRAARFGLSETEASLFVTACVEAYTNVLRHSRGRVDGAPVELVVRLQDDALVVEFIAVGENVEVPAPPRDTDFSDYPEGGFGLSIIQSATDKVEYLHRSGINTVRLARLRPPRDA